MCALSEALLSQTLIHKLICFNTVMDSNHVPYCFGREEGSKAMVSLSFAHIFSST